MFFGAIVSFIALAIVAVSHAVLPAEAESTAMGPGRPHASADLSIPNGLAVVLPPRKQKDERLALRAMNNPFISGVAVQMNWRDLEPLQGQPDWSKLDALFAAAESAKKWVHLLIFPGFLLLGGPRKVHRPICSQYNTDLAKARLRSFRCHGIECTLAVGSHS